MVSHYLLYIASRYKKLIISCLAAQIWSLTVKKILIPVVAVAVAAGAYLYQKQETSYNVLDYVPADTPIFTGQLTPFPIKDYLATTNNVLPTDQTAYTELYQEDQPALQFLAKLTETYQAQLQDPEQFVKTFGLADNVRGYFYTLGLLPVFKMEVANPQAIWDLLDKTEQEVGYAHEQGKLKEVSYRSYQLTQPTDETQIQLIVAQSQGLLTVTLNSDIIPEKLLATALGLEKVSNSLSKSGMLEEITKKHNLSDSSVGFLNHIEIIKGITTTDGNQLAKQLTELSRLTNDESLAMLHSPECAQELAGIAENWPRTIFGYSKMQVSQSESTLAFASIIESKNQPILNALKALRGYIPDYTQSYDKNVFATSLGLDINKLSSSLTDIWSDLQSPSYQCMPLAQMQAQIAQGGQSLAMVGMSANAAAGVKGISTAVFDYALTQVNDQPQLASLDALIAIHADDPEAIFNSVKMFSPELQQITLTNNGPSVPLKDLFPIPPEVNLDPQLAIKGNHLIIYTGAKGKQEAEKLGLEKLSAKGIYQVSFDSKKLFTPIVEAAELAGEIIPEEAMFLIDYDARMNMALDVNDKGIRFDSTVNQKAPK